MARFRHFLVITALLSIVAGCSRSGQNLALVTLRVPSQVPAEPGKQSLPTERLACYAVTVSASDIAESPANECGVSKGTFTPEFVQGGQAISLQVARGVKRTVKLYLYLGLEGETSCPKWDSSFENNAALNYGRTYLLGSGVYDLSSDSVAITMNVSYPVLAKNVNEEQIKAGKCRGTDRGELRAALTSTGDVLAPDFTPFQIDFSAPNVDSIVKTSMSLSDSDFVGVAFGGSGVLKWKGNESEVNPAVRSLTRKPDGDGSFYGLLEDGQVVKIDSATGEPVELGASCPFASCRVPPWMEAVSAGLNNNLYAKDHSGQIYSVDGDTEDKVTLLPLTIPEYFSGFVYF